MSSLVFFLFFFFFSILLFLFCRVSFLSFFPSANRVPVPTACLNEPLLLPCDHRLPFSAETFLFSWLRLESEGKRHACAYTKTVYESTLLLKERASPAWTCFSSAISREIKLWNVFISWCRIFFFGRRHLNFGLKTTIWHKDNHYLVGGLWIEKMKTVPRRLRGSRVVPVSMVPKNSFNLERLLDIQRLISCKKESLVNADNM